MTVTEVKHAYSRQPFVPFRIHYPGGPAVDVPRPEFMMFSPTNRIVFVMLPDGRDIRIDAALISALEELEVTTEPPDVQHTNGE